MLKIYAVLQAVVGKGAAAPRRAEQGRRRDEQDAVPAALEGVLCGETAGLKLVEADVGVIRQRAG